MKSDDTFLNRYTSLPVLLDMLVHKHITLLDPEKWEDRNDSYYIKRYKKEMGLKTVLALCFSTRRETFHHWKVFSDGPSGVCVEFDKERLTKSIAGETGIRCDKVSYKYIKEVRAENPDLKDWPFLKRKVFTDEGEFRVLYENANEVKKTKELSLGVDCIRNVRVSPWLPKSVAETVITVIKSQNGCQGIEVQPSTILENEEWKAAVRQK